jgi:hypothetical protein
VASTALVEKEGVLFKRLIVSSALLVLPACGSDGGPAAPPVTTPAPNYSGTYVGAMLVNDGAREVGATGRTTVTHAGSVVQFGMLDITTTTASASRSFPLSGGTLSGDQTVAGFIHADPPPNAEPDCGSFNVTTVCRFRGNRLNVTIEIEPQKRENCNPQRLVGELTRQ